MTLLVENEVKNMLHFVAFSMSILILARAALHQLKLGLLNDAKSPN